MTHMSLDETSGLSGRALIDHDGVSVGTITGGLGPEVDGLATWLAVDVGDPARRAVVPIIDLLLDDDSVRIPHTRQRVLEAPKVAGAEADSHEDHTLRAYYDLPSTDGRHPEHRTPHFDPHPGIELD